MTRKNPLGKIVRIAVVHMALLMITSLMVATVGAGTDTCDYILGDFDYVLEDGDTEVYLLGEVPGGNDKEGGVYVPTPEEECSADLD
jgi:hypothetical protein